MKARVSLLQGGRKGRKKGIEDKEEYKAGTNQEHSGMSCGVGM